MQDETEPRRSVRQADELDPAAGSQQRFHPTRPARVAGLEVGQLVTGLPAWPDLTRMEFTHANAGRVSGFFLALDGGVRAELESTRPPLGAWRDSIDPEPDCVTPSPTGVRSVVTIAVRR